MTATFPDHGTDSRIFLVSALGSISLHALVMVGLTFLPEARVLKEESPTVQVTLLPKVEAPLAPQIPTPPLQSQAVLPKTAPPPLPQAMPHRSQKLMPPLQTALTPSPPLTPSPLPPPRQAKPILRDTRASRSLTVKSLTKRRETLPAQQTYPSLPTVNSRSRSNMPAMPTMPLQRKSVNESQSLPAPPLATTSRTLTATPPVHSGPTVTRPKIITSARPVYPRVARESGWEGTVIVRTLITTNGIPSELKIRQSCGHPTLDEAALNAVKSWTFRPAKNGNIPITKWVDIPIKFDLNS